ncbi:hypothetical protein PFICI_11305 [Pestalotiopsis fici W106-1]|uniref:Carboxylic ester hydrolase n=1 Tax=Pestalotiopsis fici (strain W106-1 / CGMCC3.15140) TaxID=1229662 RepID=W3WX33_PESFW|nr:uncharacterized protein PFICI_11305 [Pestalotiopsis fici W106-1]ETS77431.1 hypothetical protein PFICI_11305 [Pestalotiopsis fici W106-1]
MKLNVAVFASLYAVTASAVSSVDSPTATISAGRVIGTSTSVGNGSTTVNQFFGIPYAEPPIGDLRFAPAVTYGGQGDIQATAWPNACIQQGSADLLTDQSEDCLYLNVFAPSGRAPGCGRAVMVWIHGGALKTGSSAIAEYNATLLAANQDVVVVTINYRLSLLGFSNSPALAVEDRNAGFYDQRMALQWVQDNIASFGGDRNKVTIFGQSSGGTSVSRLVGTMVENPPFRAAIVESGWYDYASIMDIASDVPGLAAWNSIVAQLNCSSSTNSTVAELACMRTVDSSSIQSALSNASSLTFTPVNDDVTQLTFPEKARRDGRIARVPILTGQTANEGTLFQDPTITSLDEFVADYPTLDPVESDLASAYPTSDSGYASQFDADGAIDTDAEWTCSISRIAGLTSQLGIPFWRYYFNATFPNTEIEGYGVYHSAELPLVFGTFEASSATLEEVELSTVIQGAWASFAKDPWGTGPGWPRIDTPMDHLVAALGSPNKNETGWTMVANGTIDSKCWIYQSIYDSAAGGTPWW